ncbi:hypothetical protein BX600DRAFT_504762 [Xylariales sp. PMI_506]|nr:hypothetical protein BX600DRAFT_504762 [Xylariales sp. PMI_506]
MDHLKAQDVPLAVSPIVHVRDGVKLFSSLSVEVRLEIYRLVFHGSTITYVPWKRIRYEGGPIYYDAHAYYCEQTLLSGGYYLIAQLERALSLGTRQHVRNLVDFLPGFNPAYAVELNKFASLRACEFYVKCSTVRAGESRAVYTVNKMLHCYMSKMRGFVAGPPELLERFSLPPKLHITFPEVTETPADHQASIERFKDDSPYQYYWLDIRHGTFFHSLEDLEAHRGGFRLPHAAEKSDPEALTS